MTAWKCVMCIATLALLAVVRHAAIGASSEDGVATASAVTVDAIANDTSSIPDFDGDGTIGLGDFVKFAAKYGLSQVDQEYDAQYDLNGDGRISFSDFLIFAENFGKEAPSPVVRIPDANLRAAIETALGKDSGAPITVAEMATLERLRAFDSGISDLTGLESATNLTELDLNFNDISDISALSGMTNLILLGLGKNEISDISVLSGLTNLMDLFLGQNDINDISALSRLTNLMDLSLGQNDINDISALSRLTNLTDLGLGYNDINDISALASLTNLRNLYISDNDISDISALSVLTNLRNLSIGGNNITDLSVLSGLTDLTELSLDQMNLSDLSALSGLTNLTWLSLLLTNTSDLSVLSGLTNLTLLNLSSNKISNISALSGLTNLNVLLLSVNDITDISALSGLTNLNALYLGGNDITDISALSGLTNLAQLALEVNSIADLLPLAGLKDLKSLNLRSNNVVDISSLSGMTVLESLSLEWNNVKDISALEGLTSLMRLNLANNKISDISALAGMTSLMRLSLWFNKVAEISPLLGLTNLTQLELRWNPLNDRSLNDRIPELERRGVSVFFTRFRKGDFDIELVFADDFSEDEKDVLRLAARRWMSVVIEDLPDYTPAEGRAVWCGNRLIEIPAGERIDDLRIYMTTFKGDRAVGWGGPSLLREQTYLPVLGCMGFDLERANLLITGLHEIGHVLGFGAIWDDLGFYQNPPDGNEHFNGPLAISAFDNAGGRNYPGAKVPLADPAHWSGDVFGNGELMLPWGGGALSAITVRSLADLGYGVDVTYSDAFTLPGATTGAKIAIAPPRDQGFGVHGYRPDVFTQLSDDRYDQGSIEGILPIGLADGFTGRRESTERSWGAGITFDRLGNLQMWNAGSTALAAPELTCGAGLMNEPVYVVDPQGRIVRTINR